MVQPSFDSTPVLDEDAGAFYHVVFALGGGTMLGLHRLDGTSPADWFDERRVGLDHVAFACTSRAELEQWRSQLDKLGIPHGGIKDASYGSGLSFRDPDNIALGSSHPRADLCQRHLPLRAGFTKIDQSRRVVPGVAAAGR